MIEGQDLKIVFAGPMGAGKTTAIRAISEIDPVSTDMFNHDREQSDKETTTVALDYGQLTLEGDRILRLYGTPGQGRFSFMWDIVGAGALGVILLLDASRPDLGGDAAEFLDAFGAMDPSPQIVIGVSRLPADADQALQLIYREVENRSAMVPVLTADIRTREAVVMLIDTLLSLIEGSQPELVS